MSILQIAQLYNVLKQVSGKWKQLHALKTQERALIPPLWYKMAVRKDELGRKVTLGQYLQCVPYYARPLM